MKREMHHKERQMNASETRSLMDSAEIGILSVNGDDGYPYGVPVNCVYINDCIYFHCAQYGYKLDAIKANPKVCFTVILAAQILRNKFTANFASVIATGKATIVEDDAEKMMALKGLFSHSSPGFEEEGAAFIEKMYDRTAVVRIDVEEITGKKKV